VPDSSATPSALRRHGSYVVYEKAAGRIVHLLHVELMEGASVPQSTDIEREAVISGSRTSGISEASLGVLAISPSDIKRGAKYAVDLKTGKLHELKTEKPRRLRFADADT
jgi:hypothetical protein